ncbi:MAG: hypothetical protein WCC84_12805 [Candidatus Cybelea sp.]
MIEAWPLSFMLVVVAPLFSETVADWFHVTPLAFGGVVCVEIRNPPQRNRS